MDQGVSGLSKAGPVRLSLDLSWGIYPSVQGYMDPLIRLSVASQVLPSQDPMQAEELILVKGDLGVNSFPPESSPS